MTITKGLTYDLTKIYFDGILHLAFVRREVLGFQAWISKAVYSLEITFKTGTVLLAEYEDMGVWKEVITLIGPDLTTLGTRY